MPKDTTSFNTARNRTGNLLNNSPDSLTAQPSDPLVTPLIMTEAESLSRWYLRLHQHAHVCKHGVELPDAALQTLDVLMS